MVVWNHMSFVLLGTLTFIGIGIIGNEWLQAWPWMAVWNFGCRWHCTIFCPSLRVCRPFCEPSHLPLECGTSWRQKWSMCLIQSYFDQVSRYFQFVLFFTFQFFYWLKCITAVHNFFYKFCNNTWSDKCLKCLHIRQKNVCDKDTFNICISEANFHYCFRTNFLYISMQATVMKCTHRPMYKKHAKVVFSLFQVFLYTSGILIELWKMIQLYPVAGLLCLT